MKTSKKSIPDEWADYTPEPKSHTAGMILILIILLLLSRALNAQSLTGSFFMEKTVMGVQSGVMVKKQNNQGYLVGMFYQKNIKNNSEVSLLGYEYTGLILGKRIFGYDDINLSPYARVGMSDRSKFVLSPGILVSAQLKNRIGLEVHTAIRAGQASAAIGLSYQLSKRRY